MVLDVHLLASYSGLLLSGCHLSIFINLLLNTILMANRLFCERRESTINLSNLLDIALTVASGSDILGLESRWQGVRAGGARVAHELRGTFSVGWLVSLPSFPFLSFPFF